MRTITLTGLLLLLLQQAQAQTAQRKDEGSGKGAMFTVPTRELSQIPLAPLKDDDVLFIIPCLYFEKEIVTIDVMPQAGAYRINFPEPRSAR